jgi:hypothetical protein
MTMTTTTAPMMTTKISNQLPNDSNNNDTNDNNANDTGMTMMMITMTK